MKGALNGKVGGAFTSSATQHGGQEVTLFSIITNLFHFGMTIVGLPYSHQDQMTLDDIVGGAPYGATTIAGGAGQRQPSSLDLDGARHQGMLVARVRDKAISIGNRYVDMRTALASGPNAASKANARAPVPAINAMATP
jgi:NAD(P)H dehydrogenase (quinone)